MQNRPGSFRARSNDGRGIRVGHAFGKYSKNLVYNYNL